MALVDKRNSNSLREKYNHAVQTAKSLRMDGSADERDGKLHVRGTVNTEDEKNKIWNAIKTVPDWQQEIVADIRVKAAAAHATSSMGSTSRPAGSGQPTTYTVQSGDTLGAIAKRLLGNPNEYMEIYNANRDQLSDPDVIKPGQILKIPQHVQK